MGSSIDVSSTGQLVNKLLNPPDMGAQFAKGLETLNAWKQYQAKGAEADAYRQSVDPTTGQIDLGKYNALLSQSPAGAWNFGAAAQQAGQAVGQQGLGTTANVESKLKQYGAIGQLLYPLLQSGANNNGQVDPAAVQSQLDRGHGMGLVTDQQYTQWSGQLKGMSPQDAYGFVLGANMGNQEAFRQLGGNVAAINTGPQTVFKQTSPLGAQPPASSTTQMGLTPEGALKLQSYLAEPYDYTDRSGVEHRGGTKGDFFKDNNINPFAAFTDGTIPAPGSTPTIPAPQPQGGGPVSTVTTGRAPAAAPAAPGGPASGPPTNLVPPAAGGRGAPGPATVPPVAPPAPVTGSTPTPTEALPKTVIDQGQKDYIAAQAASRTLPDRISPLRNAMGLLRANPDLQTGPGQQQYSQTITGIAAALNLPVPQGVSQQQELAKYLAQYVRGQGQTAGQTDLGRLENEASNPNPTTQSRAALQVLIAKAIGVERLRTAAYDQFNAQYSDAGTAAVHSGRFTIDTTQWLKNQDPTAYAVDEMDPQAVAEYFRGLSGTVTTNAQGQITGTGAKGQFIASRNNAKAMYGIDINPNASVAPPPAAAPPPKPPPPRSAPPPPPQTGAAMTPSQMYGSGSSAPPGP